MSVVKCQGNGIAVDFTGAGTTVVYFEAGRWEYDPRGRTAEVTTTGSTGTEYEGVLTDPTYTIDAPRNTTVGAEIRGLVTFAKPAKIYFFRTAPTFDPISLAVLTKGTADLIVGSIIESGPRVVNDPANDVQRIQVTGKGGGVYLNVVPPLTARG